MSTKKKAKEASAVRRLFVLPDGTRYEISGENGKYVFCGGTQFRRKRGQLVTEKVSADEAPCAEVQDE